MRSKTIYFQCSERVREKEFRRVTTQGAPRTGGSEPIHIIKMFFFFRGRDLNDSLKQPKISKLFFFPVQFHR